MILEFYLRDYIEDQLTNTDVYTSVPTPLPTTFYMVDKLGTTTEDMITTTHIAVQSWGGSKVEAATMNETIKALFIGQLIEEPEIASVKLNSDYPYNDTKTKHPRYQAVFDIVHY